MPKVTGYARDPRASDREDLQKYMELLEVGKNHRRETREDTWRLVDKQYKGKQWSAAALADPTANLTVVNMSFGTITTIKPYITDQEPRFYLEPFSADATRLSAALQEVFLNRLWRHPPTGAQEALKAATFEYLKYGDGMMKATFALKERLVERGETSTYAEIFVDRVSPWDVWIDPYSEGLTSARWVAHRAWFTEDEARKEERFAIPSSYEFTDRRIDDDDRPNRSNAGLSEGQRWVQLIEFYDVTNGMMMAFPANADATHNTQPSTDLPWQVIEDMTMPLVQMPNHDLGDSPWHMGDLEQIADLQTELNHTRSELMTHRRRNVAKTFVRKGALDENAEAALQSPIVNEFVEIDTPEPLQNVVIPYSQAPISADNYGATREIKDDIREITGITEYQRGVAPEITRTATEASIMDASANVKLGAKLSAVEEAARRLGSIILGIAREVFPETDPDEWAMFIGGEEAQRLSRTAQGEQISAAMEAGDPEGAAEISNQQLPSEVVMKPTNEMFIGEYEVLVEVGSTEYRDPKVKEQRLKDMFFELVEVAPQLQQLGVNFDMAHVARLWLESTDIIDVDSILNGAPPPDPMAEMGMAEDPMAMMGGEDPMAALMAEMGGMGAMPPDPSMEAPEQAGAPLPAPEDMALMENTGMLETGEIAPATLPTPSNAV